MDHPRGVYRQGVGVDWEVSRDQYDRHYGRGRGEWVWDNEGQLGIHRRVVFGIACPCGGLGVMALQESPGVTDVVSGHKIHPMVGLGIAGGVE